MIVGLSLTALSPALGPKGTQLRTNGSMVLYRYCVSFFAPLGEKMTHKELNMIGKRKSYKNWIFRPRYPNANSRSRYRLLHLKCRHGGQRA